MLAKSTIAKISSGSKSIGSALSVTGVLAGKSRNGVSKSTQIENKDVDKKSDEDFKYSPYASDAGAQGAQKFASSSTRDFSKSFANRLSAEWTGLGASSGSSIGVGSGNSFIGGTGEASSYGSIASSAGGEDDPSSETSAEQQMTAASREFVDDQGQRTPQLEHNDNGTPSPQGQNVDAKDPYKQVHNVEPDKKPEGTDAPIENERDKIVANKDISEEQKEKDLELYDRLDKLVNVVRNDSVGFGTNLSHASRDRSVNEKEKSQVIAFLVDTFKNDPNKEVSLNNLEKWGGNGPNGTKMDVFLSDKLSYGLNKEVGGYVASGEGTRPQMALPYDLTNYTHTDISRHEGVHLKDVLSDGKLDGLVHGEDRSLQSTMLSALKGFQQGVYNKEAIEKLDIGNLRYGAGYLKFEGTNKDAFTYGEARAVLEQEWADKPEEFRAVGKEFADLADEFEKTVADYDESYLKKDGRENGTAMK